MNLFKRDNKYGGQYPMKRIKVRTGKEWSLKKWLILNLIVWTLAIFSLYHTNEFFEKKTFVFKEPVVIKLNNPISIADRVREVTVQIIENDGLPLTENERYLCKKFGDQCKTALEVQRRENPTGKCDAFYVNKNGGTIDIGFLQINSIHLTKDITLAQLVDCKSNIDIAYEIYKRDGWTAWVAYNKMVK
jgi:hypothetical protein